MGEQRLATSGKWSPARGFGGWALACLALAGATAGFAGEPTAERRGAEQWFSEQVAPLLERRCLNCHDAEQREGGLSLASAAEALAGGDSGEVLVPGDAEGSYLLELLTPRGGKAAMPRNGDPLAAEELAAIRRWIAAGAPWPKERRLSAARVTDTGWWSFQPLRRPAVPPGDGEGEHPIDSFLGERLAAAGLTFAPEADRRTLLRRLTFNLHGLPPSPAEMEAFLGDRRPGAYERVVERLLASPRYGERWARHWLDVVHYADTHGYDKDKPRPHAWPYRDYVIRALNEDKPWARFVEEQVAGDVLYPGTRDGVEALGFIAAGPWDYVGHAELPETKIDGRVARNLDRDDMVVNTLQSFNSLTVGCARCHNHKFDPIAQDDYYALQAVFAALDRADRTYHVEPRIAAAAARLEQRERELAGEREKLERLARARGGEALARVEKRLAELGRGNAGNDRPEYGYHSAIEPRAEVEKWVQVDLGESGPLDRVVLLPAYDDFNDIGAGFGFPPRYRVEGSDDPEFRAGVVEFPASAGNGGAPSPGAPRARPAGEARVRYVRVTAEQLAPRKNDFIFALAELQVFDREGNNVALGAPVAARDSIEAAPRWGKRNLVDGIIPRRSPGEEEETLRAERETLWARALGPEQDRRRREIEEETARLAAVRAQLPEPSRVYAGTVHHGSGNFLGTGHNGGRPRPIHLLARGEVTQPGREIGPGALALFPSLPARFELPSGHAEGERRAALARWLTAPENALTWRSIVNRAWQYHFGRGLVETPNDFGRMGAEPSHAELLDWLAVEFRDRGGSLKQLHRLIVTSRAYRQGSLPGVEAAERGAAVDAENRLLWRMNRRKLEAEAVRDSVLRLAGKLDLQMGGPGFQDFVIEKPEHSPHYQYRLHDPEDPRAHRRSVYRFIVRSQLQPFMTALDCADPSQQVARRSESVSPLQALALLNSGLVTSMAKHFAARLEAAEAEPAARVRLGFLEALGREPEAEESAAMEAYAREHGWANFARVLFNLNEFHFID